MEALWKIDLDQDSTIANSRIQKGRSNQKIQLEQPKP